MLAGAATPVLPRAWLGGTRLSRTCLTFQVMARCRYPILLLAALGSLAASLVAQGDRPPGPEAPSASIAVFAAALYNDQANLREATDSTQAGMATEVLRARLRERLTDQVISFAAIDSLEARPRRGPSPGAFPATSGWRAHSVWGGRWGPAGSS